MNCVQIKAQQRHNEFRGTLPKPWGDASLSVFGFPNPEAQEHLEKHPNIHVTNTAPDYWQARGRRPQTVERRQIENIKTAIEFARRDDITCLGHFDNDEFLHVPSHANVGMRLARLDDNVMCARALPVEYLVPDDPDYTGLISSSVWPPPLPVAVKSACRPILNLTPKFRGISKPSGWKILLRVVPELMAPRIHFCDYRA